MAAKKRSKTKGSPAGAVPPGENIPALDPQTGKERDTRATLIRTLKDLFQLDTSDLDFGIYRILNLKKREIATFIEKDLFAILDLEPDLPLAAREQFFDHLAGFFSRYYDNGDFTSKRRYSRDATCAIPSNGEEEEVYLYWANHDQYYVKTGETFSNLSFQVGEWTINFEVTGDDIHLEKANNKAVEKKSLIYTSLAKSAKTITVYFSYRTLADDEKAIAKKSAGKRLSKRDYAAYYNYVKLMETPEIASIPELKTPSREPGEISSGTTDLEWYLVKFCKISHADFFIHKNLGEFLSRELDFYIKNEMFDIDALTTLGDLVGKITQVQLFKTMALKIIGLLAQFEDIQKRLWEKKKFVLSTDYLITLDYIDPAKYSDILQNSAQLEEWKKLNLIDLGEAAKNPQKTLDTFGKSPSDANVDLLKQHPTLPLDTRFFDSTFKHEILSKIGKIDEKLNGILINSDNFHGLNLLLPKYHEQIRGCYTDPPFNAKKTEIIYKNKYRESSWLAFVFDRIQLSSLLLKPGGVCSIAIDDYEVDHLKPVMDAIFESQNHLGTCVVIHNPGGRQDDRFFPTAHEYMLFYGKDRDLVKLNRLPVSDAKRAQYTLADQHGKYKLRDFMRSGANSRRVDRPGLWYPIYLDPTTLATSLAPREGMVEILPIDGNGVERCWRWDPDTFAGFKGDYIEIKKRGNTFAFYVKERERDNKGEKAKTIWRNNEYSAVNGTNTLKNLFGLQKEKLVSFPKSPYLVQDVIRIIGHANEWILDFFAGSGTTGHACLSLNKADSQHRKFILIEMGTHFNTVLKPRIAKIIYSDHWKDGQPLDADGSRSQIIKYHALEQYEDTLLNLEFNVPPPPAAPSTPSQDSPIKYVLDVASKETPVSLNLASLADPFHYHLNIDTKDGIKSQPVDLVETFNYLAGIFVDSVAEFKHGDADYLVVKGTRDARTIVVVWRNKSQSFDLMLDKDFVENVILKGDHFDEILVNGDSLIPNAKPLDEMFKQGLFRLGY